MSCVAATSPSADSILRRVPTSAKVGAKPSVPSTAEPLDRPVEDEPTRRKQYTLESNDQCHDQCRDLVTLHLACRFPAWREHVLRFRHLVLHSNRAGRV